MAVNTLDILLLKAKNLNLNEIKSASKNQEDASKVSVKKTPSKKKFIHVKNNIKARVKVFPLIFPTHPCF